MFTHFILLQFLSRFDDNKHAAMLDVYLTSFENHRQICETALRGAHSRDLQGSVHDLKSLCLTLGAQNEGSLAASIEDHLKAGRDQQAFDAMPALFNGLDHVTQVLRQAL